METKENKPAEAPKTNTVSKESIEKAKAVREEIVKEGKIVKK